MQIKAHGHPNVTAKHATTIAVTKDKEITVKGDCFIGVAAEWDIDVEALKKAKQLKITIRCGGVEETITATGHPDLTVSEKDLVIRKSDWVDDRTLAIKANKAAKDLDRKLVAELQKDQEITIELK